MSSPTIVAWSSIPCWSRARSSAARLKASGARCWRNSTDSEGQLLAGSLMDYMVPTACEIPDMHLIHQHSPSPLNPLGVKGVGEGGPIAPPAVIANAVSDALRPFAVEFN